MKILIKHPYYFYRKEQITCVSALLKSWNCKDSTIKIFEGKFRKVFFFILEAQFSFSLYFWSFLTTFQIRWTVESVSFSTEWFSNSLNWPLSFVISERIKFHFYFCTKFWHDTYNYILDNEVDEDAFLLLDDAEIRRLIPESGPRMKFMKNFRGYIQSVLLKNN